LERIGHRKAKIGYISLVATGERIVERIPGARQNGLRTALPSLPPSLSIGMPSTSI